MPPAGSRAKWAVVITGAFVCLATFGGSTSLNAHEGATGVVKQRMDAMSAMGDAMKSIASMLRGASDYSDAAVSDMAARLRQHSEDLESLFPEGSMMHPSTARPEIWTNWPAFKTHAADLERQATALAAAAQRREKAGVAVAFRSVGQVCSACHKDFRTKK